MLWTKVALALEGYIRPKKKCLVPITYLCLGRNFLSVGLAIKLKGRGQKLGSLT